MNKMALMNASFQSERFVQSEPLPRPRKGVAPSLLLQQVVAAVPFLFSDKTNDVRNWQTPLVNAWNRHHEVPDTGVTTHQGYFDLCVRAHMATVASFLPTDVDNQIRLHLWNGGVPDDIRLQMASLVQTVLQWNVRGVSSRQVAHEGAGLEIRGHDGEWFSMMAAAFCSLHRRHPKVGDELQAQVIEVIDQEIRLLEEFWKDNQWIDLLKASTLTAHNLGDLHRVLDLWNLPSDHFFRVNIGDRLKSPFISVAADLNTTLMAPENHRHFALRKPRILRRSAQRLLPIGPFFEEWGRLVGNDLHHDEFELGEVIEALVDGWDYLGGPVGYARALKGLEEGVPGGRESLCSLIPRKTAARMRQGLLRNLIDVETSTFRDQWAARAQKRIRTLLKGF